MKKLSKAGTRSEAGLGCPKCGSQQFKAKRSKKAKLIGGLTVGVGAALAPKTQVKCLVCKTVYKRG